MAFRWSLSLSMFSNSSSKSTFTLSCWNVASTPHYTSIPFSRVLPHINLEAQDVLCLQEIAQPAQKLHPELLAHLHTQTCEQSDNAVLTQFPVLTNRDIAPTCRVVNRVKPLEAIQALEVEVFGRPVVIYNCHLPIIGVGLFERMQLLELVLEEAKGHDHPTVLCGDLNTALPGDGFGRWLTQAVHRVPRQSMYFRDQYHPADERHLANDLLSRAGFSEVFPLEQATWAIPGTRIEPYSMKLDWVSLRGLDDVSRGMDGYVSDHRRLNTTLRFVDDWP